MLSVIVPSKNNGETLEECLNSIMRAPPLDKEVLVIDARSVDETPEILAKFKDKIKIIYDDGTGIGRARNLGVMKSTGDIIANVDADAVCSKDHFTKILRCFQSDPEIGVINVETDLIPGATFIQKMEMKLIQVRRELSEDKPLAGDRLFAGGCFMAFKREVWDEVGGFWLFPPFGADDHDFSVRVRAKGWKIGSVNLESWHQPRKTLKGLLKEMWGWGRGKACWIKKWRAHPLVVHHYHARLRSRSRFERILLSFLLNNLPLFIGITYLLAPIVSLKYLFKSRNLFLYIYYILRQYAYFFGYIYGWFTWARMVDEINGSL